MQPSFGLVSTKVVTSVPTAMRIAAGLPFLRPRSRAQLLTWAWSRYSVPVAVLGPGEKAIIQTAESRVKSIYSDIPVQRQGENNR